jgi:flavin-binding protein dodecin
MADGTTSTAPSHVVYRQVKLVGGTPELIHRGIDDNENVVESLSSVTHVAQVTHSLDEGLTWIPGPGPDQLYKRIRFTRISPPGLIVNNSLRFD